MIRKIFNKASGCLALCIVFVCVAAYGEANRTESATPDLSGTYNIATLTPLQRPERFGDKATLTDAEAQAYAEYWANNMAKDEEPSDPDRTAPPKGGTDIFVPEITAAAGGVGGYNGFYMDFGSSTFKLDGKYRTSIITQPANGRMPELSAAGMKKMAASGERIHENTGTAWWLDKGIGPYDNPENRPLAERCLLGFGSTAGPPALPVMYNNLKRIVHTDSHIIIVNEMNHDARVIRIDDSLHPREMRSWLGDSVGYWENDTLVIKTANFREQPGMFMAGGQLQVTERFTRVDESTLAYGFTVDDPTWSEPWSGQYPWPASEDKVYEYACHEGNYALGGILRGARLLEKEAIEQASIGQTGSD
jgi:hypothetical protein